MPGVGRQNFYNDHPVRILPPSTRLLLDRNMEPGYQLLQMMEPDGLPDRDYKAEADEKPAVKQWLRVTDPFAPAPLSLVDKLAAKQKARRKAKRRRDPDWKSTLSDSPMPGPEPRRRKTFITSPLLFVGNPDRILSYC